MLHPPFVAARVADASERGPIQCPLTPPPATVGLTAWQSAEIYATNPAREFVGLKKKSKGLKS